MRPLKQKEIFGYSVGDLGINLNFQMIGFYLAYFYTDVFGISAAHVAGLFLAAREVAREQASLFGDRE